MKWTTPTSYYTVRFPDAIDSKYWNDRFWVNAELAPLDSKGKDNQNWLAVMDAYGGKVAAGQLLAGRLYRRLGSRSTPC